MLILILAPIYVFVAVAVGVGPGVLTFAITERLQNQNKRRLIAIVSGLGFVMSPLIGIVVWNLTIGINFSIESFLVLPLLTGLILGWISGLLWAVFRKSIRENDAGGYRSKSSKAFWSHGD